MAWAALLPEAHVFAAKAEGFDGTARCLAAGTRLGNAPGATSICDAVQAPMPGVSETTQVILFTHHRHLVEVVAGMSASSDFHILDS